jgi:hypothetical protein
MVKESELKECSYFLVRYVPDVAREEFVNIGVFLFCPAEKLLECKFSDDWRHVSRFHAQADTKFLENLQSHFEQQISDHQNDLDGYIREMQQSYSNLIQLSPSRACLTADLHAQLQDLFERYVGVHPAVSRTQAPRLRIKNRMTQSLRGYRLLEPHLVQKDIPASQWTIPGDPFLFDFGYEPRVPTDRPNGRVRLIHNVSLQNDDPKLVEALVWTFERVLRKKRSDLTVGHENEPDPNDAQVRFSLGVLQHEHIRLVPVSGFDEYARSICAELGL